MLASFSVSGSELHESTDNLPFAPHGMALHCIALILISGCASSTPEQDQEIESLLRTLNTSTDPDETVFDFGAVLARGQTLRHAFTLTNPTDRPMRLRKAEALTPCCSSIGPVPESVPPRNRIELPVEWRVGHQTGRTQIPFVVHTDATTEPNRVFAVVASLISEVEIRLLDCSDFSLPLNRAGRQTIQVVCRRFGDEGRAAPSDLSASAPISAQFVGQPVEQVLPQGIVESCRDVVVDLPAGTKAGSMNSEVVLRWPNGLFRAHNVSWSIRPCIQAIPSGLVLKASERTVSRSIRLHSSNGPFRVLRVTGAALAEDVVLPPNDQETIYVNVLLDVDRFSPSGTSDLVFITNHPDQSTVAVSVLIVPGLEGESR